DIPRPWRKGMAQPLSRGEVEKAACQEVVITGEELTREGGGLRRLPIPISTPGSDSAPSTTPSRGVSKHPDTGLHNLGNYRGMVKAENRIGTLPAMLGVG